MLQLCTALCSLGEVLGSEPGSRAQLSPTAQRSVYPHQIQVQHPAAKSMIEISRTQDEEVGDGTTSVIILGKGGETCVNPHLRFTVCVAEPGEDTLQSSAQP